MGVLRLSKLLTSLDHIVLYGNPQAITCRDISNSCGDISNLYPCHLPIRLQYLLQL